MPSYFGRAGLPYTAMSSITFIPQIGFRHAGLSGWFCFNILIFTLFAGTTQAQVVTEAAVESLRGAIDASVKAQNPAVLDSLISIDALTKGIKMPDGSAVPPSLKEGVGVGLRKRGLGTTIMSELAKGGSYRFVRSYEKEGSRHIIYRLYGDGGLNYHDWSLIPTPGGTRASDVLVYYTGETLAGTVNGMLSSMNLERESGDYLKAVRPLNEAMARQDYPAAYAMFESMPPNIRKLRVMNMRLISITSKLEDDSSGRYIAALESFARQWPDAHNIPLLMIDAYIAKKQYDKAAAAVERVDALVGTDPFLDFHRGLLAKLKGNRSDYVRYIRKVYTGYSDLGDVALEMVAVACLERDTAAEAASAKAYAASPGFNQATLDAVRELSKPAK